MKKLTSILLALVLLVSFAACAAETDAPAVTTADNTTAVAKPDGLTGITAPDNTPVNVCVLTGPTGIGAVNMWDAGGQFKFSSVTAPDEIVSKLSAGECDIAVIATNLASKLYKKTNGGIKTIAVNTLGVLWVLDRTDSVKTMADLAGKKIVTTGQGANPEFIIKYLLTENGIDPDADVTIEYVAEGAELAAVWATDPEAIIIAPQPVATSITMKYEGAKAVIDLTDEWEKVSPDSALMMGCTVVRTAFLEEHPIVVDRFLTEYGVSIEKAKEDASGTAVLCEKYGIVPNAKIAEAAIPKCGLCFITGEEMETKLSGYLAVLNGFDSLLTGGMPDDGFWYEK